MLVSTKRVLESESSESDSSKVTETLRIATSSVGEHFRIGESPQTFEALRSPQTNLAVWRRALPEWLVEGLRNWAENRRDSLERVLRAGSEDLAPFLEGLEGAIEEWLTADLTELIGHFSRVTGAQHLRLAFGPIKSDRCRKFHTDYLKYRLICSYVGPGTEWLPNDAVNRAALDSLPGCPIEQNSKIVKERGLIQYARAGDVLLMKEDLHPHRPGLVHRSPPIEHLESSRVVLVLSTL